MHSVVGLFGGRREAVAAWLLLRRAGFSGRDLRICSCDRFLHERLYPTIPHLQSLHRYACLSGGGLVGTCSGLLTGILAVGSEPGLAFLLAAAGMLLGGGAGYGFGRFDPVPIRLPSGRQQAARSGNGRIMVRVAAPSTRADDAQEVLRRARAIQIYTCARTSRH